MAVTTTWNAQSWKSHRISWNCSAFSALYSCTHTRNCITRLWQFSITKVVTISPSCTASYSDSYTYAYPQCHVSNGSLPSPACTATRWLTVSWVGIWCFPLGNNAYLYPTKQSNAAVLDANSVHSLQMTASNPQHWTPFLSTNKSP